MKKIKIITVTVLLCIAVGFLFFRKHNDKLLNNDILANNLTINNIEVDSSEEEKHNELEEKSDNQKETDNQIKISQNNSNEAINISEERKIEKELSPSGFMGSSLYKVVLYTNGDVFVQTFDGNGYKKENILSEEIIAKKCKNIEKAMDKEDEGMIIIETDEIINDNMGWIAFK